MIISENYSKDSRNNTYINIHRRARRNNPANKISSMSSYSHLETVIQYSNYTKSTNETTMDYWVVLLYYKKNRHSSNDIFYSINPKVRGYIIKK